MAASTVPEALVGRQIRVFWADEDAWFSGRVGSYVADTGQHQVRLSQPPSTVTRTPDCKTACALLPPTWID